MKTRLSSPLQTTRPPGAMRGAATTWATLLVALLLLLLGGKTTSAQTINGLDYTVNADNTVTITGSDCGSGVVVIPPMIAGLPVTSIGAGAFFDCTVLTSVTIPNSVTNIGDYAFEGCSGLTAILVDALNGAYSGVGGVLFNRKQTLLVAYPGGKLGDYIVPSRVTSIGVNAFFSCFGLTSVTIPSSVRFIGAHAFESCSGLTSVTIPSNVTAIGAYAFSSCSGLTSLTIGTTPGSVTAIGVDAFEGCSGLTSVTIPSSVTSIGARAFSGCYGLTAILVDALNPAYSGVGGVLFNRNQSLVVAYPAGKSGAYIVPSSVTAIGDSAFFHCSGLTSVTIPSSATLIGDNAFFGCSGLTGFIIPSSVTAIGANAFFSCNGLTSVTIPSSVIAIGVGAFAYCPNLRAAQFGGNALTGSSSVFDSTPATVFYLPGTTGWSSSFGGAPTAVWQLPAPVILPPRANTTNGFGFTISWATNATIVVEASSTLASSSWSPISTNTISFSSGPGVAFGGWLHFNDPQWTSYPNRFYRVRQQ